MANKRSQPNPKAIKELVQLYVAMEKAKDEEELQPLLNRHDEITKKLGFPQILFRSLENMKTRQHLPNPIKSINSLES